MNKSLLIAVCLALPMVAWSADGKAAAKTHAKPAKPAASAPAARAASAVDSRVAVRASKSRVSDMGACRKKAADQGLHEVEAKQFIVTCLRGQ